MLPTIAAGDRLKGVLLPGLFKTKMTLAPFVGPLPQYAPHFLSKARELTETARNRKLRVYQLRD